MAQYEMQDGERVLVSRTKPANARRTAPSRPAAAPAGQPNPAAARPKSAGKTTAKED